MANIYNNGKYLENNPNWHAEDSAWKAKQILQAINRTGLKPKTIVDLGCGLGIVLDELQAQLPNKCQFTGIDISEQIIQKAKKINSKDIRFLVGDASKLRDKYDLLLLIDLIEHLDNFQPVLKSIKKISRYKIFHIPLENTVISNILPKYRSTKTDQFGHLHFFDKNSAINIIKKNDYEVVDWFYTTWSLDRHKKGLKKIFQLIIRFCYWVNIDASVKLFGGASLLVVAK